MFTSLEALFLALISSIGGAFVTSLSQRRKLIAESAKMTAEASQTGLAAALAMEARAHERYESTAAALAQAEKLLGYVQEEVARQERYIEYLQELLAENRVTYFSINAFTLAKDNPPST